MMTHEDLRSFIQDRPELNRLLAREEFLPEQISTAIKYTINRFNEIPPLTDFVPTDESNFPFPSLLLTGVLSNLLLGKALERGRNRLAYSTDGVSIDDQSMIELYISIGNQLKGEFENSAKQIKIAENIKQGWSNIPSEYSQRYFTRTMKFI